MKNPVCERCEFKDIPGECDSCPAQFAYEAAMERAERVRRHEAWALQKTVPNQICKRGLETQEIRAKKVGTMIMIKCKKPDCFYRSGGAGASTCCCYMLWTGEPRGCPADKCDKYVSRKRSKRLKLKKGD